MHPPTSSAFTAAKPVQRRSAAAAILAAAIARLLRAGIAEPNGISPTPPGIATPVPLEEVRDARLSVHDVPAGEGRTCMETLS
jgi:hypothetical protein